MPKPTSEEYAAFDALHGKQVDNPGPQWVADKVRLGEKKVSSWYKTPIMMPTDWVLGLKGERGEHRRFDGSDEGQPGKYGPHGINHPEIEDMINRLKDGSYKFDAAHVVAHHTDKPTIYEGNHRARAAKKMGMEYMPVELQHMNGNEQHLHPLDVIHSYEDSKINPVTAILKKVK